MTRLTPHAALPQSTREESDRQDFVRSLRRHLAVQRGVLPARYQQVVRPRHERAEGPITTHHDVRAAMTRDPAYQLWSAAQRFSQELGWESVIDTVERAGVSNADMADGRSIGGSLRLNPSLAIPDYHLAQDIHLMPGGYHGAHADTLAAGAVYDLGVHVWGTGAFGSENELLGVIASAYHRDTAASPPRRILDMGCAIGNATLPWARTFPDAEVHAIDVAAPCLRYGHARAEAFGVPVHFSQQNAEATDFPDGQFDVVVSHIMLHETSRTALPRIMTESRRLLRPGGVALHFDATPAGEDPFGDFLYEWEVHNNNEAFLGTLRRLDVVAMMCSAGFADASIVWAPAPSDAGPDAEPSYFSLPAAPAYRGVAA